MQEKSKKALSAVIFYGIIIFVYVTAFLIIPARKNVASWISFGFTVFAMVVSYITGEYTYSHKDQLKSRVFGLPVFHIGCLYAVCQLTVSLIICAVCAFYPLPYWIALLPAVLLAAALVIGLIVTDPVDNEQKFSFFFTSYIKDKKDELFNRLLIIFAVICSALCVFAYLSNRVAAGTVGLLQIIVVTFAIKSKLKTRALLSAAAILLTVPVVLLLNNVWTGRTSPKMAEFSKTELGYLLPQPPTESFEIKSDTDRFLRIRITDVSEDGFKGYVDACVQKGFVKDAESEQNAYRAYNADGYFVDLWFYKDGSLVDLSLEAPLKMSKLTWSNTGITKFLPAPNSLYGVLEKQTETEFSVIIGKTAKSDFEEYVQKCIKKGFDVDYKKEGDLFTAGKRGGYNLKIEYTGFDTMSVKLTKN